METELEKLQSWERDNSSPIEEEDLLLLPEMVFGFVFRTRKWGKSKQNSLELSNCFLPSLPSVGYR
jgi:hypothetical protein